MTRPNWPSGEKRRVTPEFDTDGEFEVEEGPDRDLDELRDDLRELEEETE